jgi:hypothetical protein
MTPEERVDLEGKIAAARAKGEAPYKAASQEKQWQDPAEYYSSTIQKELDRLGADVARMNTLRSSKDYPVDKDPLAPTIALNDARQKKLRRTLAKITPGKPMSPALEAEIKSIVGMTETPESQGVMEDIVNRGMNPMARIGGQYGMPQGQPAQATTPLPPEVAAYLKLHPDIPVNQVMAMYAEWKRTKAKK